MNKKELYHFGTKGMKWGVRRYQNKDGSLTDAGKKRYSTKSSKVTDRVLDDYEKLTSKEFMQKYKASKRTFAKRVEKYGDPYKYRTTGKKLIGEAYEKNKSRLVMDIKTSTTSYNNGKNVVEEYLQLNKGREFKYAKYDGVEFDDVEYAHMLAKNNISGRNDY